MSQKCIFWIIPHTLATGGMYMKQEEKKPLSWEVADPKLPVVRSGRLEDRKQ